VTRPGVGLGLVVDLPGSRGGRMGVDDVVVGFTQLRVA